MFKEYVAYLKDNPEGYWFKRKCYGWGWVPARWQGWVAVFALVVWIFFAAERFLAQEQELEYFASLIVAVALIIALGYWKGEKPRWQWGNKEIKDKKGNPHG